MLGHSLSAAQRAVEYGSRPKKKEVLVKRSTVVMLLTAAALAGLAAPLAPLSAQAQTSLPPLAPLSSVRIDYVGTLYS
jgi:hypothetical protein